MKKWFYIFFIIIYITYILGIVFILKNDMIFKDYESKNFSINKEENFPKMIHQTWKNKELSEKQKILQKSVFENFPDYEYHLWTDEEFQPFVEEHFPWFLPTWNKLNPFIKKVDTIRYMWMYHYGGIYLDIDIQVLENFQHILNQFPNAAFIPTSHSEPTWHRNADMASPAILASYPGHPIWLDMLKYIERVVDTAPTVNLTTGPMALSNMLRESKTQNLIFLSEPRFGLGLFKNFSAKYCHHENHGTWKKMKI